MRTLNRMEFVGETLRAALEALDAAVPALLSPLVTPDWVKRYGGPDRLLPLPKGDNVRQGEDADWLESLLSFEQAGCWHCDSATAEEEDGCPPWRVRFLRTASGPERDLGGDPVGAGGTNYLVLGQGPRASGALDHA
ncbi:hypothetical protein OOK36_44075 [Streptomyces sp. NBC_00365]|uniref:hypothetical protein n=1 Tax=Streptomyces sp. NBC_00365 TaxID=2975726 RepID=UPI00224FDC4E|nr:hypothetical protein [Streptomyces sp. NBC_00365]MCX5095695.1 hypothetical protein [Streptomyces sp. NBC_00365]